MSSGLTIVHEDAQLFVIDKAAGFLTVPGRTPALLDSVLHRLLGRDPAVRVVHRLDQDTSGLVVFARDASTQVALQRQFEARTIHKRYVAVLAGQLTADAGRIELPLRVDLDDRPRQIVDRIHGRAAQTDWRVLARAEGRTRVAFEPITGRTHQLRVHAGHPAGLGAPIVGDRLYGVAGERLLLHAEQLGFVHPATGLALRFESPAPF